MSLLTIGQIARITHEINRAYCQSIGDFSVEPWDSSPFWQRDSHMNGVRFVLTNPSVTPEEIHENWRKQKIEEGWVFGIAKDPEKKTHPCLVPFCSLSEKQKIKDYLFVASVRELNKLEIVQPY